MFDKFMLNLYGQINSSKAPHQVNVNYYNFKLSMNFPDQYEKGKYFAQFMKCLHF